MTLPRRLAHRGRVELSSALPRAFLVLRSERLP